jgi:hypothetical protein
MTYGLTLQDAAMRAGGVHRVAGPLVPLPTEILEYSKRIDGWISDLNGTAIEQMRAAAAAQPPRAVPAWVVPWFAWLGRWRAYYAALNGRLVLASVPTAALAITSYRGIWAELEAWQGEFSQHQAAAIAAGARPAVVVGPPPVDGGIFDGLKGPIQEGAREIKGTLDTLKTVFIVGAVLALLVMMSGRGAPVAGRFRF